MYDVVTLGETMLRFTPVESLRWEQADRYDLHVGGSESNVAVGLARLGHRVAWVSRLTDNAFGRKIARQIASHGVDIDHVVWTDQDRIGTYYFEPGTPPRGNRVIYDRAASSFSKFTVDQFPQALIQPKLASYLHLSGISLGLGDSCRELIWHCATLAKQAGWRISFDVNYRAKLWTASQAAKACEPILELADVVYLPIRDARALWGIDYSTEELAEEPAAVAKHVAQRLAQLSKDACWVLTLSELGACGHYQGEYQYRGTQPVPAVGRLGGGDAFAAGFLSGWMRTNNLEQSLRWGNAAAQVKYSISGDLPLYDYSEVAAIAVGTNERAAQAQTFR